jgi:heterodisulfide reductase subunit A-like polyferredoxin
MFLVAQVEKADCVVCPVGARGADDRLESKENKLMSGNVKGSVLVVGGGIAGMQSALDLADSGYYVYLLEKSPAIGGAMAQLDKTFPTNDCAM